MSPRTSPHARSIAKTALWRQDLAKALGTTTPLSGIATRSLERAVAHFRLSPNPDAWVWQTVCGAELVRRDIELDQATGTGLTAAEIAWQEQKERRAAA